MRSTLRPVLSTNIAVIPVTIAYMKDDLIADTKCLQIKMNM